MEIVEAILTIDVPPHAAYNTNKFHWGCEFSPAINIFANSVDFSMCQNAMKSFGINSHLKQISAPFLPEAGLCYTSEFFVFSMP